MLSKRGGRWPVLSVLIVLAVVASLAGPIPAAGHTVNSTTDTLVAGREFVPGEVIVKFKDDVLESDQESIIIGTGSTIARSFAPINAKLVTTEPGNEAALIGDLQANSAVEYAEPNYLLYIAQDGGVNWPDDPFLAQQWSIENTGQFDGDSFQGVQDADIDAPEAWAITTGSIEVVVAVIDTGADFNHPDLGGARIGAELMWLNEGELCDGCQNDGIDNDGNGFVDDWRGWNWIDENDNPYDDNGHGTHVTGIIGARGDNQTGVTGVNWDVTVMALKTFNAGGGGDTADAVEAILYAIDKQVTAINASWGSVQGVLGLRDAIEVANEAGVLFVAAAGNETLDTDVFAHLPSGFSTPNIIAVAATNNRDELADFSNFGLATVDIGAPGDQIYSTWPNNEPTLPYAYLSGTSMATPHVTGAAALVKSRFPDATHLGIKSLLLNSVDPLAGLDGKVASGGRLNLYNAVSCQDEPQLWVESPSQGFAAVPGQAVNLNLIATNCATPDGIDVQVTAGGSNVDLTPLGGGAFQGVFTPSATGPVELTFTATLGEKQAVRSLTGEVVLNYQSENAPFNWVAPSAEATEIEFEESNDAVVVELPFPFNFYGEANGLVSIGENGQLVFAETDFSWSFNVSIPDTVPPNGFIAPFWDDVDLEDQGELLYETVGDAPNRRFVVSWIDVEHTSVSDGEITFQAILEETTNAIIFQYLDTSFESVSYDHGRSATIGVEHYTGQVGFEFAHDDNILRPYDGRLAIRLAIGDPGDPIVETRSFPDATEGEIFRQQLEVSGGQGPYSWTLVDGALPLGVGLDPVSGTISGSPYETGLFEFSVQVSDSSDPVRTANQLLTFSVSTGYRFEEQPFDWIDPTAGGTALEIQADDESIPLELPFTFEFYDVAYDEMNVSTNGYLTFGGDEAKISTNQELPVSRPPNGVVAAYWDDLSPIDGGGVWHRVIGEAPNRQLVIGWIDVPRYKENGAGSFEVIMEEGSNDIIVQWLDLDFDNDVWSFGSSATVGIENLTGTIGVLFHHNSEELGNYVGETAVRFTSVPVGTPAMTVEALLEGEVGHPYHDLLAASGGFPPYTWSVVDGNLPPGLQLDAVTGAISGIAGTTGHYTFTAQAVDSTGQSVAREYTLDILPGYVFEDGPYDWIDYRGGELVFFDGDDRGMLTSLPFTFNFYGTEYTELQISSNGYLAFGDTNASILSNQELPNPREPNGVVAALWDDLSPDDGGGVWVRIIGEAPNRQWVVTWVDTPRFREVGAATFQIILEEGTNRIIMQYLDAYFDDARYNWGASATIGVEAPSGQVATLFSYNEEVLNTYQEQKSIIFQQVPSGR